MFHKRSKHEATEATRRFICSLPGQSLTSLICPHSSHQLHCLLVFCKQQPQNSPAPPNCTTKKGTNKEHAYPIKKCRCKRYRCNKIKTPWQTQTLVSVQCVSAVVLLWLLSAYVGDQGNRSKICYNSSSLPLFPGTKPRMLCSYVASMSLLLAPARAYSFVSNLTKHAPPTPQG